MRRDNMSRQCGIARKGFVTSFCYGKISSTLYCIWIKAICMVSSFGLSPVDKTFNRLSW